MRVLNIFAILLIFGVLGSAFAFQLQLSELPCPLCFLQRFGLLCAAFGLLLNLRFGFRASHYAVTLMSLVFTSWAALNHISMHIIPGTGWYGYPFYHLHLYTWAFIISQVAIIGTLFMLSFKSQYPSETNQFYYESFISKSIMHLLFFIFIVLIAANMASVLFECGLSSCPGDPSHYFTLHQIFK